MIQNTPELRVVMHMSWIQVVSDRTFEERRILRDDCEPSSKVQEAHRAGTEFVDGHITGRWLDDTEQGQSERAFAGSSPTKGKLEACFCLSNEIKECSPADHTNLLM